MQTHPLLPSNRRFGAPSFQDKQVLPEAASGVGGGSGGGLSSVHLFGTGQPVQTHHPLTTNRRFGTPSFQDPEAASAVGGGGGGGPSTVLLFGTGQPVQTHHPLTTNRRFGAPSFQDKQVLPEAASVEGGSGGGPSSVCFCLALASRYKHTIRLLLTDALVHRPSRIPRRPAE